jgi:hypothetical protein
MRNAVKIINKCRYTLNEFQIYVLKMMCLLYSKGLWFWFKL